MPGRRMWSLTPGVASPSDAAFSSAVGVGGRMNGVGSEAQASFGTAGGGGLANRSLGPPRSGQPGRRPKAGMRRDTASRLPARRARSRCDKAMGPVCPFPLHNETGFGPVSVCAAGRFPACGRRRCERLRGFEGKPGAPRRESGPHGPEILCKSVQRFRVPVKVRGEARTRRNARWRAALSGVRRWHVRAAALWGPNFHAGVGLPRNAYGRQ